MKVAIPFLLLIAFVLLMSSSCSLEHKLAMEEGQKLQNAHLMLIFPDEIEFINSRLISIENQEFTEDELIDSSLFLHKFQQEKMLIDFKTEMIKLLNEYGFRTYTTTEWDSFLIHSEKAFILDFSQLQLEEILFTHKDEEAMPDGYTYTQEFVIDGLAFNSWIAISKVNDTNLLKNTIFCETVLKDHIEGLFLMNNISGEVYYDYNFEPLSEDEVLEIVPNAAIDISLNIMDFIINNSLEKNLLKQRGVYPERFWRYIPSRSKPSPSYNRSGYIIVE